MGKESNDSSPMSINSKSLLKSVLQALGESVGGPLKRPVETMTQIQRPNSGTHPMDALMGTWSVARVYWFDAPTRVLKVAWFNFGVVLLLQVVRAKGSTMLSWITRNQFSEWGKPAFWRKFATHLSAITILAMVEKLYQRSLRSLRMKWSQYLTRHFMEYYLKLQMERESWMYNIEQELAYDIDKFVDLFLDLMLEAIQGMIHVFFYARLLNQITPQLGKYASISAILGTIVTTYIGRGMPRLHQLERDAESDYQYALNRTRENVEAILFYNGEGFERQALLQRYEWKQSKVWDRKECRDNAASFSANFRKVISIVPYILIMSHLGAKRFEGALSQTNLVHNHSHSNHGHSHGHQGAMHHSSGESEGTSNLGAVVQGTHAFAEVLYHMLMIPEVGNRLNADVSRPCTDSVQTISGPNDPIAPTMHVLLSHRTQHCVLCCPLSRTITQIPHNQPSIHQKRLSEFSRIHTAALQLSSSLQLIQRMELRDSQHTGNRIAVMSWNPNAAESPSVQEPVAWLRVEKLTLETPKLEGRQQTRLISNLSFTLASPPASSGGARGMLVCGRSGVGKTSLLRCIAGLWSSGTGRVFRPPTQDTMFIPQKPYLTLGTLRQQLLYPENDCARWPDDAGVLEALRQVGLMHVLDRFQMGLGSVARWSEELSVGEQQRLAFARLLILRPAYAILDEATSACDLETEFEMYSIVERVCRGWLSVGHRSSIAKFHMKVLRLRENGSWEISRIDPETQVVNLHQP